ncbi:ECF transporter S component [Frisingicoccus sp.]|uniref:ECF transporter S component n=1 Tax=Frisingicoccus sp. TaxID=1918627 RepID=UPI0025C3602A|nr:ECF transporter S component [Frisingicoccus sp.]MDD6231156.1 ECF transporter S component [Frisingicoccus sp.]MDY4835843.1 ECF transporter S component [Frisingicoccus sp.]MDY4922932.1 ECF transporter S component [Frisingicoccus sp.]
MESKKTLFSTRELVTIGLFSALAYVLMLLESPGYLGFLRIEFSDVPAILGGLGYGPAAGVFIELIKNLIKVLSTKTIGAGELSNFLVGSAFVIPLSIIYRKWKGKHKLLVGYVVSVISMCIAGMLVNYFITVPIYSNMFGGMEALIGFVGGMTPGFLPTIDSMWKLIVIGITPFNVVKGTMMAVVSYYVFKLVKKPLQF